MNSKGQGLVEYLVLVCLVAVAAIAVVRVVGANIREQYAKVSNAITNGRQQVRTTPVDRSTYRQRGMDDFAEGAR